MMNLEAAVNAARAKRSRAVTWLADLVRIPSVSSDPARKGDVLASARAVAGLLRSIGMQKVRLVEGASHPAVIAEWGHDPSAPTLLIYTHHDVQPAEEHGAFIPSVRGGALHGRGASDDKGPLVAHIAALASWLETAGRLPLNVIVAVEGEEEVGSQGFARIVAPLKADVAVASDTRMLGRGRPALTYALRGFINFEIRIQTGPRDLHSGAFGGAAANALQATCDLVAGMFDSEGRVSIPGFYDDVRPVHTHERAALAREGPRDSEILKASGAVPARGERGFSLVERTTILPAVTLSGVAGGHTGAGVKSIVPGDATAKVNMRLVPDQEPDRIEGLVRLYVAGCVKPPARASVHRIGSGRPVLAPRDSPEMRAAATALRAAFGRDAALVRSGGSIPAVEAIRDQLGIPTVLMGFALPDDGMHGPNEQFRLENLFRGTEACVRFLWEVRQHVNRRMRVPA